MRTAFFRKLVGQEKRLLKEKQSDLVVAYVRSNKNYFYVRRKRKKNTKLPPAISIMGKLFYVDRA
jgi:hypothetical protein